MTYFQLFLQTFVLEWVVLLFIFHRIGFWEKTLVILLANGLTHPLIVFGILRLPDFPLLNLVLAAELVAVLLEALIYRYLLRISWGTALLGSLLANLFSWEMGPRLSYLLQRWNLVF